jgi:HK97 family phage portal protein
MANVAVVLFDALKSVLTRKDVGPGLQAVNDRGGWFPIINEPFAGAWQRNLVERRESILAFGAVYAIVTLIASDIGKIRLRLVQQDSDGIWSETTSPAFSPVLRKPNRFQNRIKFIEQWIVSKLLHGNTYVLLQRDNRGVVVAMYVLDPTRVKPLVADDGSVYYSLGRDNLSGLEDDNIVVPASEIIHDVMVPLYHPLCGVSPLTACGAAAAHGLTIQRHSQKFFSNGSRPGGILTAPGKIEQATADRIKAHWEQNFAGDNSGRVAVLGDDLKYAAMSVNAVDAQLIEQLRWDEINVCTAFHVPPYMIGVGPPPTYNNIEALNQQYYTQCLQSLIESIELCLDEGLGLVNVVGQTYGSEFDINDLLRMDTATQYDTIGKGIGSGLVAPNEGRKQINLKPVKGGDTPYLQQQNFSLAALDRRDQSDDPFALEPKRDQNTPTQAQQDAAAAAATADAPAPAKSFSKDEIDTAAGYQMAKWALHGELEAQLQKLMAAA